MTWTATMRTMAATALVTCGACALLAWSLWPAPTPAVTPGTQVAQPLPPALPTPPAVAVPGTQTPTQPPLRAHAKTPAARKKTHLPPAIFDQPETYLMATGALQSEDDRRYTLSSVLDRRTGETQVYAVAEPLPLFSLSTDHGAVGAYYGLKSGDPVFRGMLSQEVFRTKNIRAGGMATLDSDGEWFAGIGAEWRR